MIYAVKDADGNWTGMGFETLTPSIEAFYAEYGQSLVLVNSIENTGTYENPVWVVVELSQDQVRDPWRASRFQVREALREADLLVAVEAAVVALGGIVQRAWDEAVEFKRLSPAVLQVAGILELTAEQLDVLFERAMQIEV